MTTKEAQNPDGLSKSCRISRRGALRQFGAFLGAAATGTLGAAIATGAARAASTQISTRVEQAPNAEIIRSTNYRTIKLDTGSDGTPFALVELLDGSGGQYIADLTVIKDGSGKDEIVLFARSTDKLEIFGEDAAKVPNNPAYKVAVGRPTENEYSTVVVQVNQGDSKVIYPLNQLNSVYAIRPTSSGGKVVIAGLDRDVLAYSQFDIQTGEIKPLAIGSGATIMQTGWTPIDSNTDRAWGIPEAGSGLMEMTLQGTNLSVVRRYVGVGSNITRVNTAVENGQARPIAIDNWRDSSTIPEHNTATIYDPARNLAIEMSSKLFSSPGSDFSISAYDAKIDPVSGNGFVAIVKHIGSSPEHPMFTYEALIAMYDKNDPTKQTALSRNGWIQFAGTEMTFVRNMCFAKVDNQQVLLATNEREEAVYNPEKDVMDDVVKEGRVMRLNINNGVPDTIWYRVPVITGPWLPLPHRQFIPFAAKNAPI